MLLSAMTPAIFTCLRSQFPSVVSGTIKQQASKGPGEKKHKGGGGRPAIRRAQLGFFYMVHTWIYMINIDLYRSTI